MKKIGILVGSLRRESYNKKIAHYLSSLFPADFSIEFINIGELPLFSEDLEENPPQSWTVFRNSLKEMNAFLFVSPEYNRSVPAALKNALDVGSRPYGQNLWSKKPGAIVSVSIGRVGGFGANHHLRQSMTFLDVYMLQQPEVYLGDVANLLNEKAEVTDEGTKSFLQQFVNEYVNWVNRF